MKKTLSILLAVVLLAGLAAPAAFAITPTEIKAITWTTPKSKATNWPIWIEEEVELQLNPAPDADVRVVWDVEGSNGYIFSFRPSTAEGHGAVPGNDHVTFGDQHMWVVGRSPGKVTITAMGYEWDLDADQPVLESDGVTPKAALWTVKLENVQVNQDANGHDPVENGLCFILKTWWNDLKWTWTYEIHPWFKNIYFSIINWFKSIPETIKGWFV